MADVREIPLRIGLVSFLNMFPFAAGLAQRAPAWSIISAPPSRLLEHMIAGDCDIAMVPSFGYLAHRGRFGRLARTCIGSQGASESVLILSDTPLAEVRLLELDSRSQTSNALARILLQGYWNRPDLAIAAEPLPMAEDRHPAACVRIGDRAMRLRPEYAHCYDLGRGWFDWQGLPFVFAVWATQGQKPWDAIGLFLSEILEENLRNMEQLLAENPSALPKGVSRQAAYRYLTESLRYRLGERELEGLERYGELIVAHGIPTSGD